MVTEKFTCLSLVLTCLMSGLLSVAIAADSSAVPAGDNTPAAVQEQNPNLENDGSGAVESRINPDIDLEREKRELKLMIEASLIILAGFFLAVFLFTLFRMARRYRILNQAGKKRTKTEYSDAWSNYRLKDEDIPK